MNSHYPGIYLFTALPLNITRWISFSGREVPAPAASFVTVLLALSGFFNILTFFRTREYGLFPEPRNPDDDGGVPHVIQGEEQTVLRKAQEDRDKTNVTSIPEQNPASLEDRQESSSGAVVSSGQRVSQSQVSGGLGEDSDLDFGRLPG
jgi:hypothetical protein